MRCEFDSRIPLKIILFLGVASQREEFSLFAQINFIYFVKYFNLLVNKKSMLKKSKYIKTKVSVPFNNVEKVKQALGKAGAGQMGN